ncbi:hypothetical protein [Hyalangium gracile]|uniref:hypothetical protein n=1 Tax=Hyalangium gracile TaxID=394092 RepID=UPI001CC9658E|nr:hypothetical protein [Hyalangium gracile]
MPKWRVVQQGRYQGAHEGSPRRAGFRTLRRERTNTAFDASKAERTLGIRFRPLEETFTDAVEWFVRHGYVDRARLPRGVASPAARVS